MISLVALFSSVCSSSTFSKPTFIRLPTLIMSCSTIMGTSSGMSMCRMRWNMEAPSILAASYRLVSTAARQAI